VQIGDNRAAEWVRRSNPVALGLLFSGLAGQQCTIQVLSLFMGGLHNLCYESNIFIYGWYNLCYICNMERQIYIYCQSAKTDAKNVLLKNADVCMEDIHFT
jgi:hypothetical protein